MPLQDVLFRGSSEFDQLIQIFKILGTPTDLDWSLLYDCPGWHEYPNFRGIDLRELTPLSAASAVDLLKRMFVFDPAKRPSAEECLRHPYFASVFNKADLEMYPLMFEDFNPPPDYAGPVRSAPAVPEHRPSTGEPKDSDSDTASHDSVFTF